MVVHAALTQARAFLPRGSETSDGIHVEEQRGVHPTYLITDRTGAGFFYKSYEANPKPILMLAERLAHRAARGSAALFHRAALAGYFSDPAERSREEARVLERWRSYGIDAPRVLGYDQTGLYLERIEGTDLAQRLASGTVAIEHRTALTEQLHRIREAALTIDDASFLHSDPSLENAIGSDEGRVALIDPGVLTRPIGTEDLDAAFSIAYLAQLQSLSTTNERDIVNDFAEHYIRGLGPRAREKIREHAAPVPDRLIAFLDRVPHAEVRAYARWLSRYDAQSLDSITRKL